MARSAEYSGIPVVEAMKNSVDVHHSHLAGSVQERRWAFSQVTRVVTNGVAEQLGQSRNWRVFNALRAAMLGITPPIEEALDAIRRGERQLVAALAEVTSSFADTYRFRLREPFTVEDYVEALQSTFFEVESLDTDPSFKVAAAAVT